MAHQRAADRHALTLSARQLGRAAVEIGLELEDARDLARALVTMVRERPGGLWHVANAGTTTWFEVAQFAGSVLGRDEGFATPISTDDLDPAPLARRPIRSDLSTKKWESRRWTAMAPWRSGVIRLLEARALGGGPTS